MIKGYKIRIYSTDVVTLRCRYTFMLWRITPTQLASAKEGSVKQ